MSPKQNYSTCFEKFLQSLRDKISRIAHVREKYFQYNWNGISQLKMKISFMVLISCLAALLNFLWCTIDLLLEDK